MTNHNVVNWFEIPVSDLGRAQTFYQKVLAVELQPIEFGGTKMALFHPVGKPPEGSYNVHGALVQGEGYTPGPNGPLLYLNAGDDLAEPLARVAGAGGKVVQPKTSIGEHGFMAIFVDTEGNRLALHSMS